MILASLSALLLATSPYRPLQREQPDVAAGNERLVQGDPAGALGRYDDAERALGTRPELDYDRGTALVRQGKTAEGIAALRRAAESGSGPLASRALQNVGGALDAAGDRDGAIATFADALSRDPANEDARFNLEVLLRRKAQERKSGGAKDEPEKREAKAGQREAEKAVRGGAEDEAGDRKGERDRPKPGRRDEPKPAPDGAERSDPRPGRDPAGAPADREEPRRGEAGRSAAGEPASRQDAERLLDALRARERNLPPGTWQRRETRRRDVEKDW